MIFRVFRAFESESKLLSPKSVFDGLLGRLPVPKGIPDSRPRSRGTLYLRPSLTTQDFSFKICEEAVNAMKHGKIRKELYRGPDGRRPTERGIRDKTNIEMKITKMCRLLNGKSMVRIRRHKLTIFEKSLIDIVSLLKLISINILFLISNSLSPFFFFRSLERRNLHPL